VSASADVVGASAGLPPSEVVALARDLVAVDRGSALLVAHEPLKKNVHRLCFELPTGRVSVVAKRLSPERARANQLVVERWLPAEGLEWGCPELRGVVREPSGSAVWHIYEDIAGTGLDSGLPDPDRVVPVVELVAELHTRFAGHALLPECREHGGELGMDFFTVEVARAVGLLKSIGSFGPPLRAEESALRDRLLDRVERLHGERDGRALLLETYGGPDTLLHGDLWTTNTLVVERAEGPEARLIDWDHVGVGPVSYDLSSFLYRFSPEHRPWILGRYRQAAGRRGWRLPDDATLNLLFETAEYARCACCLAEMARFALRAEAWAFEMLAEIETWFAIEPALHGDGAR
jgi:hypothetical protein